MQDFLNPKSMLTPGVAGAFIMFLVNGLLQPFPEVPPRYMALGLSFLVGAAVLSSQDVRQSPLVMKAIYWLLDSLVIFVVGFGSSHLAADAARAQGNGPTAWVIPSAHAQEPDSKEAAAPHTDKNAKAPAAPGVKAPEPVNLAKQLSDTQSENQKLKSELQALKEASEPTKAKPKPEGFFRRW